jgi:hypothetical protein
MVHRDKSKLYPEVPLFEFSVVFLSCTCDDDGTGCHTMVPKFEYMWMVVIEYEEQLKRLVQVSSPYFPGELANLPAGDTRPSRESHQNKLTIIRSRIYSNMIEFSLFYVISLKHETLTASFQR